MAPSDELFRSHLWCPWANQSWHWLSLGKPGCPDHASPIYLCDVAPNEAIREFLDGISEPYRILVPFGWSGGKGRLAGWIVQNIPQDMIYVKLSEGAASVFWYRTRPFPNKALNESDEEMVHPHRFLQGKAKYYEQLAHRLIHMGLFLLQAQTGLPNTKRLQCQGNSLVLSVPYLQKSRLCGHREGIRRETGAVW